MQDVSSQTEVSWLCPTQSRPPYAGAGSLQSLVLVASSVQRHDLLTVHAPQEPQEPSTKNVRKLTYNELCTVCLRLLKRLTNQYLNLCVPIYVYVSIRLNMSLECNMRNYKYLPIIKCHLCKRHIVETYWLIYLCKKFHHKHWYPNRFLGNNFRFWSVADRRNFLFSRHHQRKDMTWSHSIHPRRPIGRHLE